MDAHALKLSAWAADAAGLKGAARAAFIAGFLAGVSRPGRDRTADRTEHEKAKAGALRARRPR